MGVVRTKTIKNKHAAGGASSKSSKDVGGAKSKKPKGTPPSKQVKDKGREALLRKLKNPKKRKYTDDQLGIPTLNKITPVGVVKPRGKKKGKVFVDDRESMSTILSLVQAEKNGQIESKMIKARQMEEIREARKVEQQKKEEDKKSKLEDAKDALRKKRKRKSAGDEESLKEYTSAGTKAGKAKTKKRVSFA
ncbi:hypothetical protein CDV31_005361 [Fusarium ambrosium]|uniref:60S ribosomal subunit assembly/export protein LOC1 n=1 Tax=Fusarium ambrosium TaxID=131363 RepID=A0A428UJQ4_9HYPO|nr:hypothetical protein CDV31_005361 [Fusarium ambrosium]